MMPSAHDNDDSSDERNKSYNKDGVIIDEHENSPEAAGVARGTIRTASGTLSKRAAVGRLPVPSAPRNVPTKVRVPKGRVKVPSTAATRARGVPKSATRARRVLGSRARQQRQVVAKVSDRFSTGLDGYDAYSEANESVSSSKKEKYQKDITSRIKKGVFFMGALVKNTILGAAVFETYDYIIIAAQQNKNSEKQNETNTINEDMKEPQHDNTSPLSIHLLAGICGGSAHSVLSLSLERFSISTNFNKTMKLLSWSSSMHSNNTSLLTIHPPKSNMFFIHNIFHHSLAHGILFFSYETIKRLSGQEKKVSSSFSDTLSIGFAGGIAGVSQHITSHYTELLTPSKKNQQLSQTKSTTFPTIINIRDFFLRSQTPSIRSTIISFPASAIGFIAYEFGKEVTESLS